MIKPFESILGTINPDSFNISDGEVNTGTTFNGKHIYKKTFDVSSLPGYTPDAAIEDFVRFEGTLKRSGVTHIMEFVSVSNLGIVLEGLGYLPGDTGYFSVYYTKTIDNENVMNPFISSMAVIGALTVIGFLISKNTPEIMQMAFNLIK